MCPRVSGRGVGWQWACRVGGTECGSACTDLLRKSPLSSLPPPVFALRSNNREGTQPCPSTENWIKDLLSMALPIRKRPSFPTQSVTPIRNFPWASYTYPSEGRQNENHNHRKLIKLITWTTALSNSMKIWATLSRATQDGEVMVESSDKMWSTGEGNGKPLQYSCLENPMKSMKKQKDRTLKDELPR